MKYRRAICWSNLWAIFHFASLAHSWLVDRPEIEMPADNLYPGIWLPCESCEGQVDYLQLLFWCFPLAADDAAPQPSAKAECRYSIANRSAVLSSRFKFGKLIIREAISGIYNVSTTNGSNLCWDSLSCGLLYNYFKCILMAQHQRAVDGSAICLWSGGCIARH